MGWITPITDRTRADVDYANAYPDRAEDNKGALNLETDLNRIEGNCEYLSGLLNEYGYPVSITVKTDWTKADKPTQSHIDRIRDNVNALIEAYKTTPGSPEIIYHNYLDWIDVNSLELNLKNINSLLQDMIAGFKYCGVFYCGAFNI